jgi:sortase B
MSVTKKLKDIDKKYPLKRVNKLIDNLIMIVGVACMFLGTYCLLDNYNVYNQVTRTQKLGFKPEVSEDSITFSDVPLAKAWLTVPDTQIDYPVMQGKDNLEYINKDCFGKYSLSGSIFADFQNKPDFTDKYNLLYGHHMDKGLMFGSLDNWNDENFFKKHVNGFLLTKDKVYKIRFVKIYETEATDPKIFSLDLTNTDRGLNENKRYIALTTCKVTTDTKRTVLLGELTEISIKDYQKFLEKE